MCFRTGWILRIGAPLLPLLLTACATTPPPPQQTLEQTIPTTMANLRGHQALYNEGWLVITSTQQALAQAREEAVESSAMAIAAATGAIRRDTAAFTASFQNNLSAGIDTASGLHATGSRLRRDLFAGTDAWAAYQRKLGMESLQGVWNSLIKGNLSLGIRSQADREALMAIPGGYFSELKEDFGNIYDLTAWMNTDFATPIAKAWDTAFERAATSFDAAYRRSGQAGNSLAGLGDLLVGYFDALYEGAVQPSAKTLVTTVKKGVGTAAQAVFLPTATAVAITGRTVEAVGMSVYYTGKLGVEIVAPTVEAGLLGGLSLLSFGTLPVTYTAGYSAGALNQVAFTASAPVAATATTAGGAVLDAAKYVAFVTYDALAGTTEVAIHEATAGVVLGYNALTALPVHALMGAVDTAVFLAWDGPRLVVAMAQGKVGGGEETLSVGDLPVGSVVDLQSLRDQGIAVKTLSDDPETVQTILQKLPDDLRQ
ncbi:MAG: hypothetical protein COX57_09430 [Alphaproteobacteria bacterium CG_4_10_14_0_2_um_filter_63_37]|nr:MAG: hypothetical protein COX57_09430 [Alphaproteobacteria bacterium CG_4_10_14_0_2_um_filter_63_37]